MDRKSTQIHQFREVVLSQFLNLFPILHKSILDRMNRIEQDGEKESGLSR